MCKVVLFFTNHILVFFVGNLLELLDLRSSENEVIRNKLKALKYTHHWIESEILNLIKEKISSRKLKMQNIFRSWWMKQPIFLVMNKSIGPPIHWWSVSRLRTFYWFWTSIQHNWWWFIQFAGGMVKAIRFTY